MLEVTDPLLIYPTLLLTPLVQGWPLVEVGSPELVPLLPCLPALRPLLTCL